jgi:hypothetical protein
MVVEALPPDDQRRRSLEPSVLRPVRHSLTALGGGKAAIQESTVYQ